MNINSCHNFKKVANFSLNHSNSKPLWRSEFVISNDELTNTNSRCYIISVNDIIKKIGKTETKQGIKDIAGYGCGNSGSPSNRTTGIHYYIGRELMKGNNVSLSCIWAPTLIANIYGLSEEDTIELNVSIPANKLEEHCIKCYKKKNNNNLPPWNKQESGRNNDWPEVIKNINRSLPPGQPKLEMPSDIEKSDDFMKLYCWKHHNYDLFNKVPK